MLILAMIAGACILLVGLFIGFALAIAIKNAQTEAE